MTSNVILLFSAHLRVQRLETITAFLHLNGRLPTIGLRTLETQPCYNTTHTNSFQQIAVAATEDPPSRQRYSAFSGSGGAKGLQLQGTAANMLSNQLLTADKVQLPSFEDDQRTVSVTVLVTKYKTGSILERPKQRAWGMALGTS